ncbi:hypothetical protein B0H10DRAFT_2185838 [Mycena sp. CBHHK59/15]|nr:hypothetical protein B0H10DRAFT_2185838 [Mycena sp. CBHHK59/15]
MSSATQPPPIMTSPAFRYAVLVVLCVVCVFGAGVCYRTRVYQRHQRAGASIVVTTVLRQPPPDWGPRPGLYDVYLERGDLYLESGGEKEQEKEGRREWDDMLVRLLPHPLLFLSFSPMRQADAAHSPSPSRAPHTRKPRASRSSCVCRPPRLAHHLHPTTHRTHRTTPKTMTTCTPSRRSNSAPPTCACNWSSRRTSAQGRGARRKGSALAVSTPRPRRSAGIVDGEDARGARMGLRRDTRCG